MYREGRFRMWRPKQLCECGTRHTWGDKVEGCARFRPVKRARSFHAKGQGFQGRKWDSALEARIAADLAYQLSINQIESFEAHKVLPLIVNGERVGNYVVDFVVQHFDGTTEYIEGKGIATELWRLKWKILEAMMKDRTDVKMKVLR